ncbi:hypothetical protein R3P38DRAFT_2970525 [Favolaschia claudopus]|uniref:Uncharacterized protein n=1 Tax=Favolaschia claudopus TaxID=2862362 RepID=A0AAW0B1Y8_9AGAR
MQISRILWGTRSFHHSSRLLSTSNVLSSIPRTPLPPPPLQPLALPFASVPSVTQTEIDKYVVPLYERNWLIFTEMPNLILNGETLERRARTVSLLGKKFRFLRGRSTANFLADVVDFALQEEHEPRITMFLGRTGQHLLLRTHTSRTIADNDNLVEQSVCPGISARDLRLAILLENHYQDKYVASQQALRLRPLLLRPDVPDRDMIRGRQEAKMFRSAGTVEVDATWTPSTSTLATLPSLPELGETDAAAPVTLVAPAAEVISAAEDEGLSTVCTDAHFDAFLRPLYARGWHAAFLPIMNADKLYVATLCLTGFFRFTSLTAAAAFVRDIVGYPWYKEDNAELHFLLDAQTVRAQLVYPPEHIGFTIGNLRAAWRIEQIFHDDYLGSTRISGVHPYRYRGGSSGAHQPETLEELQRMRETPLRGFHVRHNAKMARLRI